MILPPLEVININWGSSSLEPWVVLIESTKKIEDDVGRGDAYLKAEEKLLDVARSRNFGVLPTLLKKRVSVRALTQLWLDDSDVLKRLMSPRLLEVIVEAQRPRLGRVPLLNMLQLYLQEFDRLDRYASQSDGTLREQFESVLVDQVEKVELLDEELLTNDLISVVKQYGGWILKIDGPAQVVRVAIKNGITLEDAFSRFGLKGFDNGRYADVCRAYYYIEKLHEIDEQEWSPVFDELLHHDVSKAPYGREGKRIGHAALEVLIDRVTEASEAWQDFMLSLAGDPRVSSRVKSYREWWAPLGEQRVEKVRGWFSKQDLRLFLQALEQYGESTNNDDLKRMFPARKAFLEGLFRLKMIKNTRLMLGKKAEYSVRNILKNELKVNYIKLDGQLSDKAVIYLDCGDFYLIEGSHSFKLWVYLAPPSLKHLSYEVISLSHFELTNIVPKVYKQENPSLEYAAVVHSPSNWQNKVFEFLAKNGISLDVEALLCKEDYRKYIARFGLPTVRPVIQNDARVFHASFDAKKNGDTSSVSQGQSSISDLAIKILYYLYRYPDSKSRDISKHFGLPLKAINHVMHLDLKGYCIQVSNFNWIISAEGEKVLRNSEVLGDEE
ncbi:EH signature domain-containing protein [Halomonas halodenitrificans]|uniref:EH signature domain-containing protein n=1 Tax=Halomonas halodenitrificans TaxID=28252 RepID=UPI000A4867FD|nr:EH signature domain-containing protein [Halomonas halodenitrificans]